MCDILLSSLDVPVLEGGPVILHETSVKQNTWWLKQERETEREIEQRNGEREREKWREREVSMNIW